MVMLFDQEYAVERYAQTQRNEGRQEGRQEGETRLSALITKLISLGRMSDIEKVASDPAYRDQFYDEFNMA